MRPLTRMSSSGGCRTNGNARRSAHLSILSSGCDEVEQALLGFFLSGADAIEQLAAEIDPSLFFGPTNKIIFDTILALHNEQRPVELLSLTDRLRRENNLETVGGPAAVTELGGKYSCRGIASARYYLELLRERAVRRQLAAASLRHPAGVPPRKSRCFRSVITVRGEARPVSVVVRWCG